MAAFYCLTFLISVVFLVSANPAELSNPTTNATLQGASSTFVVHSMSAPAPRTYPQNAMRFVQLDGKNYLFVDQRATWFEAVFFCQTFGLDLISIESQRKNDLLRNQAVALGMNNKYIWLSANNIARNSWMWLNGRYLIQSYVNWAQNEPSNPTVEHCAAMSHKSGQWLDVVCHGNELAYKPMVFICQDNTK